MVVVAPLPRFEPGRLRDLSLNSSYGANQDYVRQAFQHNLARQDVREEREQLEKLFATSAIGLGYRRALQQYKVRCNRYHLKVVFELGERQGIHQAPDIGVRQFDGIDGIIRDALWRHGQPAGIEGIAKTGPSDCAQLRDSDDALAIDRSLEGSDLLFINGNSLLAAAIRLEGCIEKRQADPAKPNQ